MQEDTGSRGNEDGQTLSRYGDILLILSYLTYTIIIAGRMCGIHGDVGTRHV